MGLFDKLLGRSAAPEATAETDTGPTTCPHLTLVPRWDSVEDMGQEARATGFHCETCGEDFSAAEGHRLRASEGDRIRLSNQNPSLN